MDNTENKELFLSTFRKNVQRPGAEKLLAWMETTDFFHRARLDALSCGI